MGKQLTVGDLFCGAGGFSEGFRQAGFEIRWAVDNWSPAVKTYNHNIGPKAKKMDISKFTPDDFKNLGVVDVLIGGPPCTFFSLANRGGNGDAKAGLKLVERFLEAVEVLRPKYWIMENVPNLKAVLARESMLTEESNLDLWMDEVNRVDDSRSPRNPIRMEILDSEKFGAPQKRSRLFTGVFPVPSERSGPPLTLRRVVSALPSPLGEIQGDQIIVDPLYPSLRIRETELTDHFMDTRLREWEVEECRRMKERHPWYGRMRFPDELDLPSRTIGATEGRSGRHTIVIKDSRARNSYRTPTLRESASIQGFPLSYQFCARSVSEKQRLIGNAVPIPVARAFAIGILQSEGREPPPGKSHPLVAPCVLRRPERRDRPLPLLRRCRDFVPGTVAERRVELDNFGENKRDYPREDFQHLVEWRSMLYLGYAKDYVAYQLNPLASLAIAERVFAARGGNLVPRLQAASYDEFRRKIPDATTLQAIWATHHPGRYGPHWVLNKTSQICKQVLGKVSREDKGVRAIELSEILSPLRTRWGKDYEHARWGNEVVTPYLASAGLVLSIAVRLTNESSEWLVQNWERRYIRSSEESTSDLRPATLGTSRRIARAEAAD
jgi:site-specific DNA-cytosine methylase